MTTVNASHRAKRLTFLALPALLMLAGVASAASGVELAGTGSAAARQLAEAEDRLFEAKVHKDFAALEKGFADEALYVHSPGLTQTKAEHIGQIRNGQLDYRSIATEGRLVRVFGVVGITRGHIIQTVGARDSHAEGYLAVYVKRDGRWQVLDFRTTPIPAQGGNRNNGEARPGPPAGAPPPGGNTGGQ